MTFKNSIRNLLKAEGYKLSEYENDARSMDANLIYVVRFCRENEIHINCDIVKGLLIAVWSLVGENDFTADKAVSELIDEVLRACER